MTLPQEVSVSAASEPPTDANFDEAAVRAALDAFAETNGTAGLRKEAVRLIAEERARVLARIAADFADRPTQAGPTATASGSPAPSFPLPGLPSIDISACARTLDLSMPHFSGVRAAVHSIHARYRA